MQNKLFVLLKKCFEVFKVNSSMRKRIILPESTIKLYTIVRYSDTLFVKTTVLDMLICF